MKSKLKIFLFILYEFQKYCFFHYIFIKIKIVFLKDNLFFKKDKGFLFFILYIFLIIN